MNSTKGIKLPRVGMRMIKSAIGVLLCFICYEWRGEQGIPFYSALAVLWCIRPYTGNTVSMALQRTTGTLIGAVYGLICILIRYYLLPHNVWFGYIMTAVMIVPVIYTTVMLHKKNASYFSCVVFLSIVVMHMTDNNPYLFVWNRVLDTMIGIGIGILVNEFRIPRKKRKNILFVSGVDDTLLSEEERLSDFSIVRLNRLIEEGANFTVATMRTPASAIEALQEIHLKLPVIVMDGAAVYHIGEKRFYHVQAIEEDLAGSLMAFFEKEKMHYFTNALIDNVLMIFYGTFKNEAEKQLYEKLSVSPYRNYIRGQFYHGGQVIYFMLIDIKDRILALKAHMEEAGLADQVKLRCYPSEDYKGYYYLKVYQKNTSKKTAVEYLQNLVQADHVITYGSVEGVYDVMIEHSNSNEVVKSVAKIYEPFFWDRRSVPVPETQSGNGGQDRMDI